MRYTAILFTTMLHTKSRGTYYPKTQNLIRRFPVPDDKVSWSISFPEYVPLVYTAENILKGQQVWADVDLADLKAKWNALDGTVNRVSHVGNYSIDSDGSPLNPCGRTGIKGRGCLGRWGPNHAADPIVTRWKKDQSGQVQQRQGLPVLQFVSIVRRDCGEWAIPGGMVDPGEMCTKTLQREFLEEAIDSISNEQAEQVKSLFKMGGVEVYRGYVDDPRNTDNAWMETVAAYFHDDGGIMDNITLQAGDDAVGIMWKDIASDLNLYASHAEFLKKVAQSLKAYW